MSETPFSTALRDHIDASGLSMPALGELAGGLDQAYIWRMSRGERPPASRNVVICLCIALRLTVSQTDEILEMAGHLPVSARRGARPAHAQAAVLHGPRV